MKTVFVYEILFLFISWYQLNVVHPVYSCMPEASIARHIKINNLCVINFKALPPPPNIFCMRKMSFTKTFKDIRLVFFFCMLRCLRFVAVRAYIHNTMFVSAACVCASSAKIGNCVTYICWVCMCVGDGDGKYRSTSFTRTPDYDNRLFRVDRVAAARRTGILLQGIHFVCVARNAYDKG